MSQCGLTVTGTRTRYKCFIMKLKSHAISMYYILHMLFSCSVDQTNVRAHIKRTMLCPETYRTFSRHLNDKCPEIHRTIQTAVQSYIYLMGMDQQCVDVPLDFTQQLWLFLTRIIYERPVLIQPDTIDGVHMADIRYSLKAFVAEQVKMKNTDSHV